MKRMKTVASQSAAMVATSQPLWLFGLLFCCAAEYGAQQYGAAVFPFATSTVAVVVQVVEGTSCCRGTLEC